MPIEYDHSFDCPYCGSSNSLYVDVSGGARQHMITDCETCCAPISVSIRLSGDEILSIDVRKENE
jgi:transcription elongation factor Elf1